MMTEHEWTEDLQAVLERDATRRPSKEGVGFIEGGVPYNFLTLADIDQAIRTLVIIRRAVAGDA